MRFTLYAVDMDEGIIRVFDSRDFEGLRTHIIGKKVYKYDTVTSTNDLAFSHALGSEKEGAVFWARSQTKGRGRLCRHWVSYKDKGLYFSIILKPQILVRDAPKITLMAAVSISCALRKFCSKEFLIKWPNDIVIHDKKISGILTEMDAEVERVKFIILGIGINTNMRQGDLPIKEATSLKIEAQKEIVPEGLLALCLKEIDSRYADFKRNGIVKIIEDARQLSSLWGRQVKIEDLGFPGVRRQAKWSCEGVALDFDEEGALIVRQNNGFLRHIFAGDVKLLR